MMHPSSVKYAYCVIHMDDVYWTEAVEPERSKGRKTDLVLMTGLMDYPKQLHIEGNVAGDPYFGFLKEEEAFNAEGG